MNPAYRLKYRHQTLARAALDEAARTPDQVAIFVDDGSDENRRATGDTGLTHDR